MSAQEALRFSQASSQRGWSHRKGDVTLEIWTALENIYWLHEFVDTLRCLNFNKNW